MPPNTRRLSLNSPIHICPRSLDSLCSTAQTTATMHLHLNEDSHGSRSIVLSTRIEDERNGCPSRALVFRALDTNHTQVMVEFLPKSEVDLSTAVLLTTRRAKGCLGLISIANGPLSQMHIYSVMNLNVSVRYICGGHSLSDRAREYAPVIIVT